MAPGLPSSTASTPTTTRRSSNVGQVGNLRRVGNPPLAPIANRRAGYHPTLHRLHPDLGRNRPLNPNRPPVHQEVDLRRIDVSLARRHIHANPGTDALAIEVFQQLPVPDRKS